VFSVPSLMQTLGDLSNGTILVKKSKDVGRLYNKSHFGKTVSGNKLQLDLLEGVFLLGEQKIKIMRQGKKINFQDLVDLAAQQIPEFETKYLLFKDLRNRGHAIKLCEDKIPATFHKIKQKNDGKKQYFIVAFSERDNFDIEETKTRIKNIAKRDADTWYGIVDEEGDITYYDVSSLDIKGTLHEHTFPTARGTLFKNRMVIFDKTIGEKLLEKEFFGKPFGEGLQLSLVEGLYLSERNIIDVYTSNSKKISKEKFKKMVHTTQPDIELRLTVFKDLKKRGLIVKTGFKFGAHFRAYTKLPDKTHAEYLVHVVDKNFKSIWAEMSRAVRLAHSVNKEIVFAQVDGNKVDYVKLGRLRP